MTFAKCNKLCNKFNNNNNNIMKILQIAKTCANSRKKKLIKMWENYATIMHTTNYPIAPLLLLLFLLPCGASLSCFQKTRRFLVTESRKWGEICDLPANWVFGQKVLGNGRCTHVDSLLILLLLLHIIQAFYCTKNIEKSPLKRN